MAIKLTPKTQITTKEHRVMCFQVNTPPNQTPTLFVYYGEVLYGETGNILTTNPNIATLTLNSTQLTEVLPENNKHNLPSFSNLYVGLRDFLDEQFKVSFSGLF